MSTDIPDLIAGALSVSRGTAYDMMREALAEQPAPATELREQEPEYTWPTVAEYECDVGFKTNDAFRMGWDMARTTNKMLGITSPPAQPSKPLTDEQMADFLGCRYHTMSQSDLEFFRLGEAAHGITGEQK